MDSNESCSGPRLCGSLDLQRLIEEVGATLAKRKATLAVGETSAGGALSTLIHGDPAHAEWFRGGMVLYAGSEAPLVEDIRDVASEHGVVSEEYVAALAQNVRRTFECQWALAESGIAGPQIGRRSAKPAGMVCLAVAGPEVAGDSAQERGTSPRAAASFHAGEERVWTTTRTLEDSGRIDNQLQFAAESLRLLRCVLEMHDGFQEPLRV